MTDAIDTSDALSPSDTIDTEPAGTPRHLWVVGVISVMWNAMGAMDYVMTQTRNEGYMSDFTPEQLEFFYSFPSWVVGTWAIAVWAAVLGSLLLLLRRRLAVHAFLISLGGMVITTLHNYVFSNGLELVADVFALVFSAVIVLVGAALLMYSRAMSQRGVLR